jgi:Tfp pilus assembly protein FimT
MSQFLPYNFQPSYHRSGKTFIPYGFTLIELVVAFSLLVSASVFGMIGFRQYSDSQKIQNAALDVALMLQKARSRAQSQLKPSGIAACQTNTLDGYEVRICGVPTSKCNGGGRYELQVICGSNNGLIEAKQLPATVTFDNSTNPTYFFQVINGSVNSGSILINGGGSLKTIQVSGIGNISVN